MSVLDTVVGWLAPAICVGCGAEGISLCDACAFSSVLPFGERCYLCQSLSPRSRTCSSCRKDSPRCVWITTSYGGLAKELIETYKFHHQRTASFSIASLMTDTFRHFNNESEIRKMDYLVVAVPTATSRVRQRGFDHSQMLAKNIAKDLKLDFAKPLRRLGQANQIGARRQQRLKQQEGVYEVIDPTVIRGRNILLADDVVTTGATIKAVTRALHPAGARQVDALVFAKRL